MADILQYLQTLQNPNSNIAAMVKGLSQQSNMFPKPLPIDDGSDPATPKPSTANQNYYNGVNYNTFAPGSGLTGQELAQAAAAGVQSGLTQDSSGNVY